MRESLKTGTKAPSFTLPSVHSGEEQLVSLSDYKGQYVVLFFYPKDNTPHCTAEVCAFRDHLKLFQDLNSYQVAVLGVSVDNLDTHRAFAEKNQLNYPLLSDAEQNVSKAYGVWGMLKFMGKEFPGVIRSTFLIDPEGYIAHVFNEVRNTRGHAEEVLQRLEELVSQS